MTDDHRFDVFTDAGPVGRTDFLWPIAEDQPTEDAYRWKRLLATQNWNVELRTPASWKPSDLKISDLVKSTGTLVRQDAEIEPGDVVSVESFQLQPRLLDVLGITPDTPQQEAEDRIVEAFQRAAKSGHPEGESDS